jgi:hypothetical protein
MDKICGLDSRFAMLNERLTLIEETIGINSFMASDKIVTADGTPVGVGSTVPPDVARYEELKAKNANVGVGSTAPVGVGSTAPTGTTETEPDTAVDGGQSAPDSGVGVGSTAPVGVGTVSDDSNDGAPTWDGTGDIDDWAREAEVNWDGTSVANEDQASALYKARANRTAAADSNVGVGSTAAPDPDFS